MPRAAAPAARSSACSSACIASAAFTLLERIVGRCGAGASTSGSCSSSEAVPPKKLKTRERTDAPSLHVSDPILQDPIEQRRPLVARPVRVALHEPDHRILHDVERLAAIANVARARCDTLALRPRARKPRSAAPESRASSLSRLASRRAMLNANPTAATPWPTSAIDSRAFRRSMQAITAGRRRAVDSFVASVKSLTRWMFLVHIIAPPMSSYADNWSGSRCRCRSPTRSTISRPGGRSARSSAAACECRSDAASGSASSSSIRRRPTWRRRGLKTIGACSTRRPRSARSSLLRCVGPPSTTTIPSVPCLSHALPGLLREGRAIDEPPEARVATDGARPLRRIVARLPRTRAATSRARSLALRERALDGERARRPTTSRAGTLERLVAKGWIEPAGAAAHRRVQSTHEPAGARARAHRRSTRRARGDRRDTRARKGFRAYLLHGVTGSGKTEVYLRLIAAELAAGRQTLLLVPEIGLTPQLVRRLRERFGEELAVLHSAVTERERFDAWRRAYRGEARLVVGTRSAVFAPLPSAGLIIVDEEHDSSYKQQTRLPLLGARSRRRARAAARRARRARLRDAVARDVQQRVARPLPRS